MKAILTASIILLFGCTKPKADSPAAAGNLTVYTRSDLSVGNIEVYLDNVYIGTVSHFSPGGISCGQGDVNVTKPAGSYMVSAKTPGGRTWGPAAVVIEDGKCFAFELSGGTAPGTTPTSTAPDSQFISEDDHTASGFGSSWSQSFTVSQTSTFVFRFASLYKAQAAIIAANQLSTFQNMQAFNAYALFDNLIGTKTVTLNPGTYYVAIRNTASSSNKWTVELDKTISLPASDRSVFVDNYLSNTQSYANGAKTWQAFTIQQGYRYFLDGCNVNTDFFIIPQSELSNFQSGGTFNSFTTYNDNGGHAPGLVEIKLSAGSYYLVSRSSQASSLTYTLERWRVN